jgi:predicted ATPase
VRDASDPEAAAAALGRAFQPLLVALEGGLKYLSGVLPSAEGPWIMVDAGYTPSRLLRAVPDVISRLLRDEGVTDAVIDSPRREWRGLEWFTGPDGGRRRVCLRLFPPPPAPEPPPRNPSEVPTHWLEEAASWIEASSGDEGLVHVDVEGMSFSLPAGQIPSILEECRAAKCVTAMVLAGAPTGRIWAAAGFFMGGEQSLALAGGGPAATDDELAEIAGEFKDLARRLAPELAYAFVSVGAETTAFSARVSTEWSLLEGGASPEVLDLLVDEIAYDGFPYQILSPLHVARLGGPPPGARPLEGGRVELSVGQLSSWLPDAPTRSAVRDEARRRLSRCLLRQGDERAMIKARKESWAPSQRPGPSIDLPANSFLGRQAELFQLDALLERGRLVTFTGPGGIGKTRLAMQVAVRHSRHRFPDGVYFCELDREDDVEAVSAPMAAALRVERHPGRSMAENLLTALSARRTVIVVDGCEHALKASKEVLEQVLIGSRNITVLATSASPLGAEGEHEFPLDPLYTLAKIPAHAAAVALFADRAAVVDPGFTLSDENGQSIAALCRQLAGMPLAIELVAARSESHSPDATRDAVGGRMEGLGPPEETAAVEAAISWSYGLLALEERHLLAVLAVFVGGWTAEAAAVVTERPVGEVRQALGSLARHSLVGVHVVDNAPRFSMLQPVRQYAEARLRELGLVDDARARHAAWAVRWARTAVGELVRAGRPHEALDVQAELGNLRAAYRWCLAINPEGAAQIARVLFS